MYNLWFMERDCSQISYWSAGWASSGAGNSQDQPRVHAGLERSRTFFWWDVFVWTTELEVSWWKVYLNLSRITLRHVAKSLAEISENKFRDLQKQFPYSLYTASAETLIPVSPYGTLQCTKWWVKPSIRLPRLAAFANLLHNQTSSRARRNQRVVGSKYLTLQPMRQLLRV